MKLVDIVEGHLNELLGKHKELSKSRMEICTKCALYQMTAAGPLCNPDKWINEKDISSNEKFEGATKGCGCRLSAKTALKHARCIVGKW